MSAGRTGVTSREATPLLARKAVGEQGKRHGGILADEQLPPTFVRSVEVWTDPVLPVEEARAGHSVTRNMASASANRGELARPQPRRLTIRVTSPADLGIEVFKAPNAFITIPEMADDASPPPWGWSVAQKSRMGTTDTVGGIVRAAAHRLTHELPDFMKELPQIRAQVEAL